jgi:hypothetical protein
VEDVELDEKIMSHIFSERDRVLGLEQIHAAEDKG